jgi:glycosyltransferase involved in cell wall biosynthesis
VRFAGYVPREQIAARYAAAHLFALASFNEGMSVATLESMAAGLPAVVTRTGGARELVAEGVSGRIVAWADVDALCAAIAPFAADRGLARRVGAAARERARGFDWDAAAERYLALFDAVAAPAARLAHTEITA